MGIPLLTMREFTSKIIGTPFKDGGRNWGGLDCYGLVVLCFRECLDIDLPSYGETSALDLAKVAGIVAQDSMVEPWVHVVGEKKEFDVVVMHRRRDPIHIGIMATPTEIIHIEEKISAVMIPINHPTIRFRYPAFFRHRELISRAA